MTEHALDTSHAHHHDESSIFPFVTGPGVALMLFGIATTWNQFSWGPACILLGLATALVGMIGWWWELVQANKKDEVTLIGTPEEARRGLKIGFGFFIGSEVMFFAAFFAFYFYSRFHSPSWPPPGYERLPIPPALLNTALLVASGICYHFAEHGMIHKKARMQTIGLFAVALLLGLTFLGVQGNEWYTLMFKEGFRIYDGTMGTAFYLLTGFHGAHVIIGATFIAVILIRTILGHFTPHKHFAMTVAGWYWHFVDVVWIGLVLCLYIF
ncbi:MAG TPA: cytochrome c oxidase subunit 3 [Oscillatoriaceae cyanobacterium]